MRTEMVQTKFAVCDKVFQLEASLFFYDAQALKFSAGFDA